MEMLPPTPANIARAADTLRAGAIVAYPTETVYGLGVDPFNPAALEKLYAMKGRDPRNPVLLIVSNRKQLDAIVARVGREAEAYAAAFWPGPLSMLLPAKGRVPQSLLGPTGKLCVRQTAHAVAAALCDALGGTIVSTSANLSGQSPARKATDVPVSGVAMCIDGGELGSGLASTVLDPESGEILREGVIEAEAIGQIKAWLYS